MTTPHRQQVHLFSEQDVRNIVREIIRDELIKAKVIPDPDADGAAASDEHGTPALRGAQPAPPGQPEVRPGSQQGRLPP